VDQDFVYFMCQGVSILSVLSSCIYFSQSPSRFTNQTLCYIQTLVKLTKAIHKTAYLDFMYYETMISVLIYLNNQKMALYNLKELVYLPFMRDFSLSFLLSLKTCKVSLPHLYQVPQSSCTKLF